MHVRTRLFSTPYFFGSEYYDTFILRHLTPELTAHWPPVRFPFPV